MIVAVAPVSINSCFLGLATATTATTTTTTTTTTAVKATTTVAKTAITANRSICLLCASLRASPSAAQ